MTRITPCLWFDKNAEEAANFYAATFPDSSVDAVNRSPADYPSGKSGDVLTVEFTVMGMKFVGLNGGPQFKFDEAISFQIACENQKEVDYFWSKLTEGGKEIACGWLKDKFGLSWQVVPTVLYAMLLDSDRAKVRRVTNAFLHMKKFDITALTRAFDGGPS